MNAKKINVRYFWRFYAFGGSQSWASLIGQDGSFLPAHNIQKKCLMKDKISSNFDNPY